MKHDELIQRLTRIEDKLDAHLLDHKRTFDLFTRAIIPGTSVIASIATAILTRTFSKH